MLAGVLVGFFYIPCNGWVNLEIPIWELFFFYHLQAYLSPCPITIVLTQIMAIH